MALTNVIQLSEMKKVSPQKENGYTPIANELLEQIISFGLSKNELLTVLAIARMTYGFSKKSDALSRVQIAQLINIDRGNVSRAIDSLIRKRIIKKHDEGRLSHGVLVNLLSINKHYDEWITDVKTTSVESTDVELTLMSKQHGTDVKTTSVTDVKTTRGLMSKQHTHKTIKTNKTIPKNKYVHFDVFWDAYPKKIAKKKALESFKRLNPSDELLSIMLKAIEKSKKSPSWLEHGGKFIPMPATWLNGERWNDEVNLDDGYSEQQLEVFASYNAKLPDAGWPYALHDTFLAERSDAINTFISLPDMTTDRINRYFSYVAEKIEVIDNVGFDWMIKPETVIGMREGKFKVKKQ